jgi:hypothetical protein
MEILLLRHEVPLFLFHHCNFKTHPDVLLNPAHARCMYVTLGLSLFHRYVHELTKLLAATHPTKRFLLDPTQDVTCMMAAHHRMMLGFDDTRLVREALSDFLQVPNSQISTA